MASGQLDEVLRRIHQVIGPRVAAEVSDEQLLQDFLLRHDQTAFAALVHRHGALVLGVCQRVLCNRHDAEDAFQATFLVLARKAGTIAKHRSLGSWLYGVAYHNALRAKTSAARRREIERQAVTMAPAEPIFEVLQQEVRAVLDEELHRLPEKYRHPLVLCYLEGKTQQQAALELGWPPGSISRYLERGRDLLRERLSQRSIVLSSSALGLILAEAGSSAMVGPFLRSATVHLGMLFALGNDQAGVISRTAVTLAEKTLHSMATGKVKVIAVILLAVGLLGSSAGVLTFGAAPDQRNGAGKTIVARPLPRTGAPRQDNDEPHVPPAGPVFDKDNLLNPGPNDGPAPPADRLPMQGQIRAPRPNNEQTPKQQPHDDGGAAILPHGNTVRIAVYSPDGKRFATASFDGQVRLWDSATNKELHCLQGDPFNSAVAFAPDGKTLAAGSADGNVRIWVVVSGKKLLEAHSSHQNVYALAFSPNGRQLASANHDGTVSLWDPATGKELRTLLFHRGRVWCVAFAPDGTKLVSGGEDHRIGVWDPAAGKLLHSWTGHDGDVCSTVFSPDGGSLLTTGFDSAVRLWDVATSRKIGQWGEEHQIYQMASFSPDGRIVATSTKQGMIRLWEAASGKEVGAYSGHQAAVLTVAISPNGRTLLSGSEDRTARLWDVTTPGKPSKPRPDSAMTSKELESLWSDLGGADAAAGFRAQWALAATPQSAVPFLRERLLMPEDPRRIQRIKEIERLVRSLDADSFKVRQAASAALEKLGDAAVLSLRKALAANPSPEARHRMEQLLARLEKEFPSLETLRGIRAIAVLERIGTPEARRVLEQLSRDEAETVVTAEARATLERLHRQSGSQP